MGGHFVRIIVTAVGNNLMFLLMIIITALRIFLTTLRVFTSA